MSDAKNTITLGDMIIIPKINHKALKHLAKNEDMDLFEGITKLTSGGGLDPEAIEKIIYAACMHDKRVTPELVEDSIQVDLYAKYIEVILKEFISSCPNLFKQPSE